MRKILNKKAKEVLSNIIDYDIDECVTLQYGDTHHWNQFYETLRESLGWDKVRNIYHLSNDKAATSKMIDLLNREIEHEYLRRLQSNVTADNQQVLEENESCN